MSAAPGRLATPGMARSDRARSTTARKAYLVERAKENAFLARKHVVVREWEDARVEFYCDGRELPYPIFDNGAGGRWASWAAFRQRAASACA